MIITETDRLRIEPFSETDAPFVLALLNQPSFIQFIGDRGVRTEADAITYLQNGPIASYATHGHGLYRVSLRETGVAIGMCGLIKRESLEEVDLGYAFLPDYWFKGYAREAAEAMLAYGKQALGLKRVVAVTAVDNEASIRLLRKVGFQFDKQFAWPDDGDLVNLYAITL